MLEPSSAHALDAIHPPAVSSGVWNRPKKPVPGGRFGCHPQPKHCFGFRHILLDEGPSFEASDG